METQTFAFCGALKLIKEGKRATRRGWNGKGQFIQIHKDPAGNITILDYINFYTIEGKCVPWVASQTDLLAEDWEEVV